MDTKSEIPDEESPYRIDSPDPQNLSSAAKSTANFMITGDPKLLVRSRFKLVKVKQIMADVMKEVLKDKTYDAEVVMFWTQTIADKIKEKVKEQGYERYKLIVNVQLFELRGQGVKMALKAIWDESYDSFAHENYICASMACSAVCCGVFFY